MPLGECVHCVAVKFKMTECVEQWICIRFCVQLKDSSTETIQMIQKAAAMGNCWFGSFIRTMHLLMHHFPCRDFWQNIKSPRWLSPLQPRFGALWLLAFPKTKITFEREEISDHQWDKGKYDRTADDEWENCVRSQGVYIEGDWGIIVLSKMFLVLVSTSINTSVFHITWLDTFWTDPCISREHVWWS